MIKIICAIFIISNIYSIKAQSLDTMTLEELNDIRVASISGNATFWDSIPWFNYVGKDVIFLFNFLDNHVSLTELEQSAKPWLSMSPGISGVTGYTFELSKTYNLTIKLNKINFLQYEMGKLPEYLTHSEFSVFKSETIYELQLIGPSYVNFVRFTPHGMFSR